MAPGTRAKTCASRKCGSALDRTLDDRVGGVLLAGPVVPRNEVEEAVAGVLADGAAAAAAADDGEEGLDVLSFILGEILLDLSLDFERSALRRTGGRRTCMLAAP